jgi:tripartite-type tricarboxylate transporter receptor subunit TctC
MSSLAASRVCTTVLRITQGLRQSSAVSVRILSATAGRADQRDNIVCTISRENSMKFSLFTGCAIAAFAISNIVAAQDKAAAVSVATYPNKPIRMIVPFAAGGGLDITARLIGQKLTEKWGQNVVIDSRPGAATIIGTEIASKAVPDGYTMLMITTTFAINPSLYARLPYDPIKDFAPVTQLNFQPNILIVSASAPAGSIKDLIALAKSKPGELTFATPGAGSAPHLSAELFKRMAGIEMIHVPYKGIPPAITDVIGGRVTMLFTTTISAAPHIKTGKVKALALTSAKRLDNMPGVPTIGETLKGYQAEAFQGMIAPAGVPRGIIEKLGKEVAAIVKLPEIEKTFEASGAIAVGSSPAEFTSFIKSETAKWGKVIKEAGIKLEQ